MFHAEFLSMFMVYLHTKFHMSYATFGFCKNWEMPWLNDYQFLKKDSLADHLIRQTEGLIISNSCVIVCSYSVSYSREYSS
jgi:hypothetical protein